MKKYLILFCLMFFQLMNAEDLVPFSFDLSLLGSDNEAICLDNEICFTVISSNSGNIHIQKRFLILKESGKEYGYFSVF